MQYCFLELEALNHGLVLKSCVTFGKSLYHLERILPNENDGAEGNALYYVSPTIPKHLVLSTIFTNVSTFFHLVKGRTWQDSGVRWCMSSPLKYSLRCRKEHLASLLPVVFHSSFFFWRALCWSLSFFFLYRPSVGKTKRKEGGARKESQPKSHHYFREQSPVLCMRVHFSDTTSATLAGPRLRNSKERNVVKIVQVFLLVIPPRTVNCCG